MTDESLLHPLECRNRERKVEVRLRTSFDDVRQAAMNTIGLQYDPDKNTQASTELKINYFISEHSPIRSFDLRITLFDIYYPTSVSFCRHVHSIPYVKTNRADRTNKKRSLDNSTTHMFDINAQGLIDMARKRLCKGCCSQDAYLWMLAIKQALLINKETTELGWCLVPNCIYRSGCPEFRQCGFSIKYTKLESIGERYLKYNDDTYLANKGVLT